MGWVMGNMTLDGETFWLVCLFLAFIVAIVNNK